MKVVFFAPYIYDKNHPEFCRTASGFGYMVNDILNGVSHFQDIYLVTHQFTGGYKENYTVCKHTKWDVIKNMHISDFIKGIWHMLFTPAPWRLRLRYLYYYLDSGSIRKCIEKIKPDLVHIHGLTYQTKPILEICDKCHIKYLLTLHGLNGLEKSVILPLKEKKYEYEELKKLEEENVKVTVVSSGIKRRICEHYKLSGKNIQVILNGTEFQPKTIKEKTGKSEKKKIVCIGTIGICKNQLQLIRAVSFLPEKLKTEIEIDIIGKQSDEIDIKNEIKVRKLDKIVKWKGFIPRELLVDIWSDACLNVVMSKSEGFGLSIIEGYAFGVPTLAFSDIDAVLDLYDPDAMMLIPQRTDEEVAAYLIKALEKNWDSEYIRTFSTRYSMKKISEQYNEIYMGYM